VISRGRPLMIEVTEIVSAGDKPAVVHPKEQAWFGRQRHDYFDLPLFTVGEVFHEGIFFFPQVPFFQKTFCFIDDVSKTRDPPVKTETGPLRRLNSQ